MRCSSLYLAVVAALVIGCDASGLHGATHALPAIDAGVAIDESCIELRAHGAQVAGDDSAFEVPAGALNTCLS